MVSTSARHEGRSAAEAGATKVPHWSGNPAGVGSCREHNVFVVTCFVTVRLSSQPSLRTSSVLVSCSPIYFGVLQDVRSYGPKPHLVGHPFPLYEADLLCTLWLP